MPSRFKWNRESYERARRLARLLSRFYDLPEQPELLRRYFDLWARHQQNEDPLLVPVQTRLGWRQGIPF